MLVLSNCQARKFILLKHGLVGEYKYWGKQGILDFIKRVGCIQFDPVDVCGRSPDLVLNSRVKDYTKNMLEELLYKERRLIDHFDKNLAIFAVQDIPAVFYGKRSGSYAQVYERRGGAAVRQITPQIRRLIAEHGCISASDISIDESIEWHWGTMASLPRAALESMYFTGELIIHHKKGTNKYYAFMKDYVSAEVLNAAAPFATDDEYLAWSIKRRIGSVGMLWNKASGAWLGLDVKAPERKTAFRKLLDDGEILPVTIQGLKDLFYIIKEDGPILNEVLSGKEFPPRCEVIAPLDSLMWDRKLIKALFNFEYTWEIYTPAVKRKYGAYVLPLLYGQQFIGRIEAVCQRKTRTLWVKNIWYEDDVKLTQSHFAAIDACIKRLARFNGCDHLIPAR